MRKKDSDDIERLNDDETYVSFRLNPEYRGGRLPAGQPLRIPLTPDECRQIGPIRPGRGAIEPRTTKLGTLRSREE